MEAISVGNRDTWVLQGLPQEERGDGGEIKEADVFSLSILSSHREGHLQAIQS